MLRRIVTAVHSTESSSGSSDDDGEEPSAATLTSEELRKIAAGLARSLSGELRPSNVFANATTGDVNDTLHTPINSDNEDDDRQLFAIDTAGCEPSECEAVVSAPSCSGLSGSTSKTLKEQDESCPPPISCNVSLDDDSYIDMRVLNDGIPRVGQTEKRLNLQLGRLDELMKKAVITPGFEKKNVIPAYSMTEKEKKRIRKAERSKTKGSAWFGMRAPEVTDELKVDLELLQMRDAVYPKKNYRANDLKVLPKFFQVGTVIEDATDFYSARLPNKERKKTIVDELLADADFRKENKAAYREIMAKRARPQKHKKRKKPRLENLES